MEKRNYLSHVLAGTIFLLSGVVFAQMPQGTGIGTLSPDNSAILDVVSQNAGALIPRVSNITTAIPNPAKGLLVYDLDRQCLSQNAGTAEMPDWVCISGSIVRFFYMPSIALDITRASGTYNLFEMYKKQFATPKVTSIGAPAAIPFFKAPTDLYYYVTEYSDRIFRNVRVSDTGVLTYDVLPTAQANGDSSDFMNVVLVIK